MAGSLEAVIFSYRQLADIALANGKDLQRCMAALSTFELSVELQEEIRAFLQWTFLPTLRRCWKAVNRTRKDLDKKFRSWLDNEFAFDLGRRPGSPPTADLFEAPSPDPPVPHVDASAAADRKRGRPSKTFSETCERTQRRKVKEARNSLEPELLRRAAPQPLMSPRKALALFLDTTASKSTWESFRLAAKEAGADIFPPYNTIRATKAECRPKHIEVSETGASVTLESLLTHTAHGLLLALPESVLASADSNLTLVCKWGCDGSSNHSEYNQRFAEPNASDASLFLTTLVPLEIRSEEHDCPNSYWRNPKASSTRLCRPLKFQFQKETAEVINEEVSRVHEEISKLGHTEIRVKDKNFVFTFELILSMIDGKVLSIVNGSKAMSNCSICKSKPKHMNDLPRVYNKSTSATLMTMSPLHARIKFMENILKISYNSEFKTWRAVTDEAKAAKGRKKAEVQCRFRETLGLHIAKVRQGMGTSNQGNTSRRFFADPKTTSAITGVNQSLIERFGTILDTINSEEKIDVAMFDEYCRATATCYVSNYPWYPMTPTVHKVLVHGAKIIAKHSLPIGMLSEEAQEAQNKVYRSLRLHHSRKMSRLATNEDVMNMMLAASDPLIFHFRRSSKTYTADRNRDVELLLQPA